MPHPYPTLCGRSPLSCALSAPVLFPSALPHDNEVTARAATSAGY
ncbi:hypothetical protein RAHE111665_11910 [Rariglobus hedericola]